MWDEIKKSINSTLYERITSPFYGTLIISWAIWNWKIIYLTIFVSENKIPVDKVSYILANYSNIWCLVGFPLLSTIILLTGMQYVSNWAYYLSLYFLKLKKDKKKEYENKEMLSIEQSIELRTSLHDLQSKYEKMLETKEADIKNLHMVINDNNSNFSNVINEKNSEINKLKQLYEDQLNDLNNQRLDYNALLQKNEIQTLELRKSGKFYDLDKILKDTFEFEFEQILHILQFYHIQLPKLEFERLYVILKDEKNSIFSFFIILNGIINGNKKYLESEYLLQAQKLGLIRGKEEITEIGKAYYLIFSIFIAINISERINSKI